MALLSRGISGSGSQWCVCEYFIFHILVLFFGVNLIQ